MTARLSAATVTNWTDIDGICQLEGIDLLELPFDRALNVVWHILFRNRDEKERAKLQNELTRPMVGEHLPSEDDTIWGDDAQGNAFLTAMAAKEMGNG